jgi:hypothetical protein
MPIVAWYMLSKESYMNLVISDVFPTGAHARQFSNVSLRSSTSVEGVWVRTALLAEEHQPRSPVLANSPTNARKTLNLLEFLQGIIVGSARLSHDCGSSLSGGSVHAICPCLCLFERAGA